MKAPQLTRSEALKLLEEHIAVFSTEEFQRKLREVWTSASEPLEKLRLRQELTLPVQGPIIEKYGYKASPAGVSKSSHQVKVMMDTDAALSRLGVLNNWLITHVEFDQGAVDHHGQRVAGDSLELARHCCKISVTDAYTDPEVLKGVEACRTIMVDAHQALYAREHPGIRQHEWFQLLGQDTVRKSLENGTIMLHAEQIDNGEVLGYISCTVGADMLQYVGSWSGGGSPPLSCEISKDENGQLRTEGTFAIGTGSGQLVSRQQGFEAKVVSSSDGRRAGKVFFCITGRGQMSCKFMFPGEQDWRGETTAVKVGAEGLDGLHTKINHVVVTPHNNGWGVGKLLFTELIAHLAKGNAEAAADLRLSVVETNFRALCWYLKLGFVVVQVQLTRMPTLKEGHVPVVLLTMQRRWGAPSAPWERFFGREVCGQRVSLLPEKSPLGFVVMLQTRAAGLTKSTIRAFDEASGKHVLDDGLAFDATEAFSRGLLIFEKPLHTILSRAK